MSASTASEGGKKKKEGKVATCRYCGELVSALLRRVRSLPLDPPMPSPPVSLSPARARPASPDVLLGFSSMANSNKRGRDALLADHALTPFACSATARQT